MKFHHLLMTLKEIFSNHKSSGDKNQAVKMREWYPEINAVKALIGICLFCNGIFGVG